MAEGPLARRRIVVTRPDAGRLGEALERLGAEVSLVPLIEIRPAADSPPLESAVGNLSRYDWVVFTSVNGVAAVGERLAGIGRHTRVAVVGPVTAEAVRALGVEPSYVAGGASDEIATGLGALDGARVLLPQADIADPRLAEELAEKGAVVDAVVAYRTVHVAPPLDAIASLRLADAVILASGSAARSLAAAGGAGGSAVLVCIGQKTAAVAREVGLQVGIVADEATSDGIIRALVSHFGKSQ